MKFARRTRLYIRITVRLLDLSRILVRNVSFTEMIEGGFVHNVGEPNHM